MTTNCRYPGSDGGDPRRQDQRAGVPDAGRHPRVLRQEDLQEALRPQVRAARGAEDHQELHDW